MSADLTLLSTHGASSSRRRRSTVSNIQQLRGVIMEEWMRIPTTTCAALVNSMARKI